MKTHLRHAFNPWEQLKYWLVGVPLTILIAYLLSIPVYTIKTDIHEATHHEEVATSTISNK